MKSITNEKQARYAARVNQDKLAERDARMRRFGYDVADGIRFVLRHALPISGSVLEIGTGKGRFLVGLAPHVQRLTSVDISAEEQRYARLNARYARLKTKIQYVLCDAARLPWPDHSFDAVVTMNAIHHLPHFPQVLVEILRVIKLTGKIVLADLSPRGFQIMARFHRSEGNIHEHHRVAFREVQTLLRHRGWITQLRKGNLQEVLVAQGPIRHAT